MKPPQAGHVSLRVRQRIPYLLILVAMIVMALYPRLLPATAAPVWRTDGVIGLVYGACIGLELVGVMMAVRIKRGRHHPA